MNLMKWLTMIQQQKELDMLFVEHGEAGNYPNLLV